MRTGQGKGASRQGPIRPVARLAADAAPQSRLRRWGIRLLRGIPGLFAGLLMLWAVGFYLLVPQLPDTASLFAAARQARVTILAADGSILDERGGAGAAHLRLGEISPWLIKAVLAVEDRRFYHHFGLDLIGTARAALRNLLAGRYVAGGSTITQQLAKTLYLGSERTLLRKLRELYLALWLEARLSKDEILELYLNRAYFGAGAYGAEAAAQTYFGKPAHALELAEAAMLAGLLKAPSRYAPTVDPDAARARAAVVLRAMVDVGDIDAQTAERAIAHPARLVPAEARFAGHFLERVLGDLSARLGRPEADLVVRSTLDPALQRAAAKALQRGLAERAGVQGAVLVLEADGAVRAHIGGRNWQSHPLDRATEIRRQPGSVFKLFVYAEAFRQGALPEDVITDEPIVIDGWAPRNIDGRFYGPVTLEEAFARSLNTVAVRLAQQTGIDAIIRLARRLGVESELRAVPSLALGTSEVSLLELARAFLPFVNGGLAPGERFIERIQDGAGRILAVQKPANVRVLDAHTVWAMQRLLRAAVARGTAHRADIAGRHIFGKTGTSQDGRDGWFLGSDGRYIVAVWVGRDDYRPVRGLSGGNTPTQIAREIFEALPVTVAAARSATAVATAAGQTRERDPIEAILDWLEQTFRR